MTVAEVLKQSGFSEAEIAALDARALSAVGQVLTTAEQAQAEAVAKAAKAEQDYQAAKAAKEAAELQDRSNREFWDNTVNPNLVSWEAKLKEAETAKINAEAAAEFYKKQNEGARGNGFVPAELPTFVPPVAAVVPQRSGNGQFSNTTPGNPTFTLADVKQGLGNELSALTDAQWKYQQLYGKPMPVAPTELFRQAEARKLDVGTYASTAFNFSQREQELAAQARQAEQDKMRAEIAAAAKAEYEAKEKTLREELDKEKRKIAESRGTNGDVRPAVAAQMTEIKRAVEAKERPDPLKMSDRERRAATRTAIHNEISEMKQAS